MLVAALRKSPPRSPPKSLAFLQKNPANLLPNQTISGSTPHRYYLWRVQSHITDSLPASEPGLGSSASITTRSWQESEEGGRRKGLLNRLCIALAAAGRRTGKPARKNIVRGWQCGKDAPAHATRVMIAMAAEASKYASDGRRASRTSFEMSGQHRRHNILWAGWTTTEATSPVTSHGSRRSSRPRIGRNPDQGEGNLLQCCKRLQVIERHEAASPNEVKTNPPTVFPRWKHFRYLADARSLAFDPILHQSDGGWLKFPNCAAVAQVCMLNTCREYRNRLRSTRPPARGSSLLVAPRRCTTASERLLFCVRPYCQLALFRLPCAIPVPLTGCFVLLAVVRLRLVVARKIAPRSSLKSIAAPKTSWRTDAASPSPARTKPPILARPQWQRPCAITTSMACRNRTKTE